MHNIEVSLEAEQDIENAIDYYFAINIDLVFKFRDELYVAYEKIAVNPQFYKYISKNKKKQFRRIQLKSFPYIIIYSINGNAIVVNSVFNTYRKPLYGTP